MDPDPGPPVDLDPGSLMDPGVAKDHLRRPCRCRCHRHLAPSLPVIPGPSSSWEMAIHHCHRRGRPPALCPRCCRRCRGQAASYQIPLARPPLPPPLHQPVLAPSHQSTMATHPLPHLLLLLLLHAPPPHQSMTAAHPPLLLLLLLRASPRQCTMAARILLPPLLLMQCQRPLRPAVSGRAEP